jgi:hypothetical protein
MKLVKAVMDKSFQEILPIIAPAANLSKGTRESTAVQRDRCKAGAPSSLPRFHGGTAKQQGETAQMTLYKMAA